MLLKRFAFLLRPSGNIEIDRGIRTFVAIAMPFLVGRSLQQPELGLLVGLCAQMLLLADVGGLYSIRVKTLLWTTLGLALALTIGTWVSAWFGLTVLVVFLGLFGAGYLTVYGENGAMAGLPIGFALLYAITLPPGGLFLAGQRMLVVLLAGIWSIFLALSIWPFQPNQPLRRVVADNFLGIARYLKELPAKSIASASVPDSFAPVRQLLVRSRQTLTYTRMGRWGQSDLRELLIVLIEDSDRLTTTLTALRELLHLHPLPQLKTVAILLEDASVEVASIAEDIAGLILGKNKKPDCDRLKLLIEAIEQQKNLQHRVLDSNVDDFASYEAVDQLTTELKKLRQQLHLATQTAQQLHRGDRWQVPKNASPRSSMDAEQWEIPKKAWWEPLRDNFSLESPLFRHALRLGLGSAIGVLIYTFAKIPHGLWIGLTLVLVLKPDFSLTFQRFFYRIIGTILGAGAVTILLHSIDNRLLLEGIGMISIGIALSLVRFHYSLAVFFITLYVLIASELHPIDPEVNIVWARVICTLIGGVLAFALSFGFLRPKEDARFSSAAVKAIEQTGLYFQAVMAVYLGETAYQPTDLMGYRNKARLANTTMQTALQRLIDDPSTPFAKREPAITLSNYIPRLGRGVTVLLTQLEQYRGSQPHPNLALFTQQVTEALTQLTRSLTESQPPAPLPPLETTLTAILSHLQQSREERLAEIAHHRDETSLQTYLHDYNIVTTELQEISRRLGAMHTAIDRFET
jgi:uncharacterized membrane protein YccC